MDEEQQKSSRWRRFLSWPKWPMRLMGAAGGMVFGVCLPWVAYFVELATGTLTEILDPMPTWIHHVLVLSVPVCNFFLWLCCRGGWLLKSWVPRFLSGFALVTAIVYALELLPLAVVGIIIFVTLFWYFGFGLLGILPSAPLFACFAGLLIHRRFNQIAAEAGCPRVGGFWKGVSVSLGVWVLLLGSACITAIGLNLATGQEPGQVERGLKIVRTFGRGDVVDRLLFLSWRGSPIYVNPAEVFFDHDKLEDVDKLYYRIYGTSPEYRGRGRRGFRGALRWNRRTGGEKVGGLLEGLSLKGSVYDTKVEKTTGIGYAEWTMVFANSRNWGNQEARARIALPRGAVVSRLTLWINGEESEAAFGGKGAVRKAYESVVSRQRDPVLVNMCAPDQIQLQCFPVPPKGEMKVRLGLTVPLEVAGDGKSAKFPVPVICASNFSISQNLLGMPKPEVVAFAQAPVAACAAFALTNGMAVVQKVGAEQAWRPKKVVAVIDTSLKMRSRMEAVASALTAFPNDMALELWMAGDSAPDAPELESAAGSAARSVDVARIVEPKRCWGGRDNVSVLYKALERARGEKDAVALVWLHGPEPVELSDGSALAGMVRKAGNLRFYDCQLEAGECHTSEKLLAVANKVRSFSSEALENGAEAMVSAICAEWNGALMQLTRSWVKSAEVPPDAAKGDEHLARLWAYEEVLRTYREGDPVSLEQAKAVALPWHIVTPVTGAVVLEAKSQYREHGLEQVNAQSVPTTPEPSTWMCLVLVVLALVLTWWLKLRHRDEVA